MTPRPIDAVIFDLDGTLTAPGQIDFAGIRGGIACPPDRDILSHIDHLSAADPLAAARAWEVVEAFEIRALTSVAPAAGLHQALDALIAEGLPLGVLTRNSRRTLSLTLERLGVAQAFRGLVAREDGPPKPDPAGVLSLAEALGVAADRVLVVGDYRHDISAGRAAGAWTAWVRTPGDEIIPEGSDFAIDALSQVVDIVLGRARAWSPPIKLSERSA